MTSTVLGFKRGDTFSLLCTYSDSDGDPIDLLGYTITSQVRRLQFEESLDVAIIDEGAGQFSLTRAPLFTQYWPVTDNPGQKPLDPIFCDVRFELGGAVVRTETFAIRVAFDITQIVVEPEPDEPEPDPEPEPEPE